MRWSGKMPSVSRHKQTWERQFCPRCGAVALHILHSPDDGLRSPKNPKNLHICRKIDFRRRLKELPLTEQEEAIIQLVRDGRTDKEAGRSVKLSEQRVANRMRLICTKMGAINRCEAVGNYVRMTEVDPLADVLEMLMECVNPTTVNKAVWANAITELEKVNARRT